MRKGPAQQDFREKWFEGFDGEEFEDLYQDDALAHVYAIDHYARSESDPRRMCYIHGLGAGAEQADYVSISLILVPLVRDLLSDEDPLVRENALKQIPRVAECLQKEEGPPEGDDFQNIPEVYAQILELVICTLPSLEDETEEVQEAAAAVLLELAAYLDPADLQRNILEYLTSLAMSVHDDDARTAALELLCNVSEKPFVPLDAIMEIVLPALSMLCQDGSFKIRRSVASGCLQVVEAVLKDSDLGPESGLEAGLCGPVARLFLTLCSDQVWSVRQACAQCFHRVIDLVVRDASGDLPPLLLERFDSMLADVSEWVRRRAHANLAEVLIAMDGKIEGYGDYFERWARRFSEVCTAPSTEEETVECLASQLPRVLDMLGPDEWDRLRGAFKQMAASTSFRVRMAIAMALPGLASALDQASVSEDLLPAAEAFLSDALVSVRAPVVDGLMQILTALDMSDRDRLLRAASASFRTEGAPLLASTSDGTASPVNPIIGGRRPPAPGEACGSWRLRLSLAGQMDKIVMITDLQTAGQEIWPLLKLLLSDPVSAVRNEAAAKAGPVLGVLCGFISRRGAFEHDAWTVNGNSPFNLQSMDMSDRENGGEDWAGTRGDPRRGSIDQRRAHLDPLRPTPEGDQAEAGPATGGADGGAAAALKGTNGAKGNAEGGTGVLTRNKSRNGRTPSVPGGRPPSESGALPAEHPGITGATRLRRARSIREGTPNSSTSTPTAAAIGGTAPAIGGTSGAAKTPPRPRRVASSRAIGSSSSSLAPGGTVKRTDASPPPPDPWRPGQPVNKQAQALAVAAARTAASNTSRLLVHRSTSRKGSLGGTLSSKDLSTSASAAPASSVATGPSRLPAMGGGGGSDTSGFPSTASPPPADPSEIAQSMSMDDDFVLLMQAAEVEGEATASALAEAEADGDGEGAEGDAEDEAGGRPRLWKCASFEFGGVGPSPSGPLPFPDLISAAPGSGATTSGLRPKDSTASAAVSRASQGGTQLDEGELMDALARIRVTHSDENLMSPLPPSTPPAPPAVSVEEAMGHLAALARSGRHVDRQLFVECCLGVAKNLGPITCQKFIVAKLTDLTSDPVPTVRLAVAKLLSRPDWAAAMGGSFGPFVALLEKLRADPDRDVSREAGIKQGPLQRALSTPLARFLTVGSGDAEGQLRGRSTRKLLTPQPQEA